LDLFMGGEPDYGLGYNGTHQMGALEECADVGKRRASR
jgi:hypothetical protein